MKIVVGLGNPGKKYAGTRHNVGFDVLLGLSERFQAESWKSRFEAEIAEIQVSTEKVLLVAPQTFMNLSGRSVRSVIDFYKIPLDNLLLVHDDLNLSPGRLRLRSSGSAGGQKGLQNTIDQLGSSDFARLRIGIGRPEGQVTVTNFVLQKFGKAERTIIDSAIDRAMSAVECWITDGIDQAMNHYNQVSPE